VSPAWACVQMPPRGCSESPASKSEDAMTDPDRQLWHGMLAHLRAAHPIVCRQWFEELEPLGVAGGALNLRAHTNVQRDYLRRTCSQPFADAALTASGRLISVRFFGPEDVLDADPASGRSRAKPPASISPDENGSSHRNGHVPSSLPTDDGAVLESKPLPPQTPAPPPKVLSTFHEPIRHEPLALNPDYSFENFVMGPGNRLAHAAANAVSTNPGRAYNPYFIHGDVGLGKTHLLQAICLRLAEADPRLNMYYVSCEAFVTQFMESVQSGQMADFRHRFRDVDVLIIDDIHFLAKRDRTQEEFFHTFNSLYQAQKQIILSSDAAPEEIPDLEARLVSRFKWGLVTKLEPPCYETRVAIIQTKARLRGLDIPENVACYIAARIDTNIRELEGAIVKLQITASVVGKPIDLELTKEALGDRLPQSSNEPNIQTILNVVTDFYNVRVTDLQSKRRQRSVALPRQVCMFLARKHTRMSLEEIGGYFGGRDHTTVMHALRTIDDKRGKDAEFENILRTLEEKFRSGRAA